MKNTQKRLIRMRKRTKLKINIKVRDDFKFKLNLFFKLLHKNKNCAY
jgi:hypothetical protein